MQQNKTIDVSGVKFTSTVFPTDEDMKLWNSLTREQQIAVIDRDIQEGIDSGFVDAPTPQEIMAKVMAEIDAERGK